MSDRRFPCTILSDSSLLFAVCHLPKELTSSPPVVVICHGLGGDKVAKGRFLVLLSERLAEQGIASVRFDFRGCGDSEGAFSAITLRRCVADLQAVIGWVEDQRLFDLSRCGLFGRSFGGLVAILGASFWKPCRAIAVQAPPFTAAACAAGMAQGAMPHLHLDEQHKTLLFEGEPLTPDFLEQLQEVDMAAVLQTVSHIPLLHISCGRDTIVDSFHTKLYEQCRKQSRAPSRFVQLPEADHSCSHYRDRQTALKETTEWFISQYTGIS